MQAVRCPITKYFTFAREFVNKMLCFVVICCDYKKIVSEYVHEIPQSQTADKTMAQRGRATQQGRETSKTYQAKQPALSLPHQDDCKSRKDIKLLSTKLRTITDSHNRSNNKQ